MNFKIFFHSCVFLSILSTSCYATGPHLGKKETIKALQNSTWEINAADINSETLRQYSLGILKKPFVYTRGKVSFGPIDNDYGIGVYQDMQTHVLNGKRVFMTKKHKFVKSQSQDDSEPLVVDSEGIIHLAYPSTNYQCVLHDESTGNCFEIQMIGAHNVAMSETITRIANASQHHDNQPLPHNASPN